MNGGKTKVAGQAGGGGAGVHPRKLKRQQSERKVLRPFNVTALGGFHESGGDASVIERLQQIIFAGRPVVGVALAIGHGAGDRAARDGATGLHHHGQVVTVGEPPHDLADIVTGEGV